MNGLNQGLLLRGRGRSIHGTVTFKVRKRAKLIYSEFITSWIVCDTFVPELIYEMELYKTYCFPY